jgi:hypothetical protein
MRQIFVFSEQLPFGHDLAGLLHPEAALDTLGWESDLDEAIRRLKAIRPPAVIVAGRDRETDCRPAVARIQAECPAIQVVEVNLETRVVRIHGGEEELVQELSYLLWAVETRRATGDTQFGAPNARPKV